MWGDYLSDRRTQLIVTGVVSSAISAAAGYLVAAKRLEAKYAQIADQEIQDVKRHYAQKAREEEKGDLAQLASKYVGVVEGLGYAPSAEEETPLEEGPEDAEESPEVEETSSIFDSDDPDTYWDFEEELRKRATNPERPYVVTHDEYYQAERDYEQVTVTYYEGDGVLADARDKPLDDDVVGAQNFLRFGHASNDRNIVYVRNEKLQLDIEVLRHEGSYSELVAGFISHSDERRRPRKFRLDDD